MQAISTRYHGPTGTIGSRIIAKAGGRRLVMHIDHGMSIDANHAEAAKLLRASLNWDRYGPMVGANTKENGRVFVFGKPPAEFATCPDDLVVP